MIKPTATLRDWHIQPSLYRKQLQDADDYRLIGYVSGHHARPDLNDGEHIYTSRLLRIDFEKGEAETLNTIYKLIP